MYLRLTLQVNGVQLMVALATWWSLEITAIEMAFEAIGNCSPHALAS